MDHLEETFNLHEHFSRNEIVVVRKYISDNIIPKLTSFGIIYGDLHTNNGYKFDVSMSNVSHAITSITLIGHNFINIKYAILNTPNGREAQGVIRDGLTVAIKPIVSYLYNNTINNMNFTLAFQDASYVNYREKQLKLLLG